MNTTTTKPLPKSLHTITVLVRVARELLRAGTFQSDKGAILGALEVLGYDACGPDPYGLADKALKLLTTEAR